MYFKLLKIVQKARQLEVPARTCDFVDCSTVSVNNVSNVIIAVEQHSDESFIIAWGNSKLKIVSLDKILNFTSRSQA